MVTCCTFCCLLDTVGLGHTRDLLASKVVVVVMPAILKLFYDSYWQPSIKKLSWECHTHIYKLSYTSCYKLELARFSTSLRIQERADWGRGTFGGDTSQKKTYSGERGDTLHTFLMRGTIGVGIKHLLEGWYTAHTLFMGVINGVETPHNIERHDQLDGENQAVQRQHPLKFH